MACPTCDHTVEGIGYGMFHCPRCGTLLNCPAAGAVSIPALVGRCRELENSFIRDYLGFKSEWERIGIAESINTPENRT